MDSDWLADEEVRSLLRSGDPAQLRAYAEGSPLRAVNDDGDVILVVVRDHRAWFIEGQGWHDANEPPRPGGAARQMLNCFTRDSWAKLPVPASVRIRSVAWDGEAFVFDTSPGAAIRSTPRQVWLAVQDSVTGRALSEERMEHNFRKLDGSAPLEWPGGGGGGRAAQNTGSPCASRRPSPNILASPNRRSFGVVSSRNALWSSAYTSSWRS